MAARNAELEAAILADPESPDAYLVYGDWLLEQGEPLGELVSVQATLAKLRKRAGNAKEKKELEKREKALLKDAEKRLGDLREHEHTWSFGFLEAIAIPDPNEKAYAALLAAPAARFLRELDIEDLAPASIYTTLVHPTITLLAGLGVPPTLRKLALLGSYEPATLGEIPPELWTKLASLRELTIKDDGAFEPGAIALPHLETLALGVELDDDVLTSLFQAKCPKLSSIQLDAAFGELDDRSPVSARRFAPLFETWAEAGNLRHLGLTNHGAGDELVDALVQSGVLKHLTSLDLSRARMSDEGGNAILNNAEMFEHLESINLVENSLPSATCRALEKRFDLAVDVEEQGERYDSIEE
jgi:uncharacterized protein (TIGR02996 family)